MTGLGILSTIPTIVFRYKIDINPFWDTDVYIRAVEAVELNRDPYFFDNTVPIYSAYPYHPYVLQTMVILNRIFPIELWLGLGYLFALFFFMRELYLTYYRTKHNELSNSSKAQFAALLALAGLIGGSSLIGVASGNISIFIHFFLIACSLRAIRLKKSLFGVSVSCALAAIVKPYYLAYGMVILIYCSSKRRGFALLVFSLLLWSSIYFSAAYIDPSSFDRYLAAVRYVTAGIQDWGYSFYGIFRRRLGDEIALFTHLVILVSVIAFPLYLRFRLSFNPSQMLFFFPSIIYFVICLNPRMKEYDFGALVFVSLSSIFFLSARISYLLILSFSIILLIRRLLLWLDANLISFIPDNLLYLKYWEVLIAGVLMLITTKMNFVRKSPQIDMAGH